MEKLQDFLESIGGGFVCFLNDSESAMTPEAEQEGKETLLFMVRGQDCSYIVENRLGKIYAWKSSLIFIDKSKVGRHVMSLTETEKKVIDQLRNNGLTINEVAKKMKISNRRVMEYCRQEE